MGAIAHSSADTGQSETRQAMTGVWWQLPGPAQFINRIVQNFQEGQNVVICLPEYFPEGLSSAVRTQVETSEAERWYTIHADDAPNVQPAALLHTHILGSEAPGFCSAATLVREEGFDGWIIWVSGVTEQAWPAWRSFIESYAHSCRSRPLAQRTMIGLVIQGSTVCHPPTDDICLVVHKWHDVVTKFDMLLYTANRLPTSQTRSGLHHQLLINTITNLALWDPLIADVLVYETLKVIMEPRGVLEEIARQRGWTRSSGAPAPWYTGRSGNLHGQVVLHSAAAVIDGDQQRLIEKRIWSAQVGALFPFVEEQRQDLLRRLRRHLYVPFTAPNGGLIEHLEDLEIGHIYWQLKQLRYQGAHETSINLDSLFDQATMLRQIRNDLAHLKCIPADLLSRI